jgi:cardiolipin synthase (CMP-forming)
MQEDLQLRLNPLRSAPNLLTLMRICLAPFLVAAILEGHFLLSFILFVAAGLTDALDGLLARLLKQRSMLGQYLDPVADKLLLSTLFLVLFYKGLIPGTVTVLVFGRTWGSCWWQPSFMRLWGGASSIPASSARPTR